MKQVIEYTRKLLFNGACKDEQHILDASKAAVTNQEKGHKIGNEYLDKKKAM